MVITPVNLAIIENNEEKICHHPYKDITNIHWLDKIWCFEDIAQSYKNLNYVKYFIRVLH
jgi:hypothetical protein